MERREKAVLLHNRRGFAPFLMCRECGCVPTCNHCSTALTYHERTHTLQCHTCGSSWRVQRIPHPRVVAPNAAAATWQKWAWARSRLRTRCTKCCPRTSPSFAWTLIPRVARTRIKSCSSSSMPPIARCCWHPDDCQGPRLSRGHACGVVNADFALKLPDFRAGERAYDLLEQVAGRAGRGDRPGEVVIQTYLPEDPVIRAVAEHDRSIFTDYDLDQRRDALYPPFVRLVNILVWSASRDDAQDISGASQSCSSADGMPPLPTFCGRAARCRRCWVRLRV